MAPSGPDDMFLVGDTDQRIYDNQVTLGSLGIHIRGRSSRLTLSYRTTREILHDAIRVLDGAAYDDLDGGADTLAGYHSVLHGPSPTLRGARNWDEEMDLVVEQLLAWPDVPRETTAVCVPTNDLATQLADRLARRGITATEITADGPRGEQGVPIGTMYRFKRLEHRCLVIAGVTEGLVPRTSVDAWERTDPARHRRELDRARSLLFVAAIRARDALALTFHGEPSSFLRPLLPNRRKSSAGYRGVGTSGRLPHLDTGLRVSCCAGG
ncbi:hypothetical protein [Streptomyces sp. NPDC059166]|uniref:hypothetical protein n=1 Tax=Streptomyces sp. NPDC059166 TaxID=3346752 RepID=UPI0036AB2FBF